MNLEILQVGRDLVNLGCLVVPAVWTGLGIFSLVIWKMIK